MAYYSDLSKYETKKDDEKKNTNNNGLSNALNDIVNKVSNYATTKTPAKSTVQTNTTDIYTQLYGAKDASDMRKYGLIPQQNSSMNSEYYMPYIQKYGLKDVSDMRKYGLLRSPEEQEEINAWTQRFADYDSQLKTLSNQLRSNKWATSESQQAYKDLVSKYLGEIYSGLSMMSSDSLMRESANRYFKYFQDADKNLQAQQKYFSSFDNEEQYNKYQTAYEERDWAKKHGLTNDQWYQKVRATADQHEQQMEKLKQRQMELGAAQNGAWDEYGNYLGENHAVDAEASELQKQIEQTQRLIDQDRITLGIASSQRYDDLKNRSDYRTNYTAGLQQYNQDKPLGQYGAGNIDLTKRDTGLYDESGNLMTVKSMSFEEDGKEILVPTVVNRGGKWVELSDEEAIDWYHKTGEYLGKFDTVSEANAYAEKLHLEQEQMYANSSRPYATSILGEDMTEIGNFAPQTDDLAEPDRSTVTKTYADTSGPKDDWTDEERQTFGYLYSQDPDKAQEYAWQVNDSKAYEKYKEQADALKEWSSKNVFNAGAAMAVDLLTTPIAIADFIDKALEYKETGRVSQKDYISIGESGDIMTGGVAEKLNDLGTVDTVFGNVGWGDAYQLVNSMIQSFVYGHAGALIGAGVGASAEAIPQIGGAFTSAVFFGSAANEGYNEAKERGASDGKALLYGLFTGTNEALFEYVSMDKLLSETTPKNLGQFILGVMKQGGIEGSEELMTSIANYVADQWINADKSDINFKIDQLVDKGIDRKEAEKQVMKEFGQSLARDAIGGFISGGVMSGMEAGTRATSRYSNGFMDNRMSSEELIRQGLATEQNSDAYNLAQQYADRIGMESKEAQEQTKTEQAKTEQGKKKGLSVMQADKLIDAIQKQDTSKIAEAARQRLNELGEKQDQADIAQAIAKQIAGEELSYKERMAIQRSSYGRSVLSELDPQNIRNEIDAELRNQDSSPYRANNAWAKGIGTARINADVYGAYGDVAESVRQTRRDNMESKYKTKDLSINGNKQQIDSAVMVNGKMAFRYKDSNGKLVTVSQDDAGLTDAQNSFVDILTSVLGNDAAYAYNTMNDDQKVTDYAVAFGTIRDSFGKSGVKSVDAALQSTLRGNLTDKQVEQAYNIGRGSTALLHKMRTKRKQGTVSLEGGMLEGKVRQAVSEQKRNEHKEYIKSFEALAQALGINFHFFESQVDANGNPITGQSSDPHGAYDPQTGDIWLDINDAGDIDIEDTTRKSLLSVASHELTHFMEQSDKYQELKDFIINYLQESQDLSFNELVKKKIADQPGLSYEGAISEVIADSCETMLQNSQYINQLMEEKPGLFEMIKGWLRKFFSQIVARDPGAKAIQPVINEVQALWDAALKDAVESRVSADVLQESPTVQEIQQVEQKVVEQVVPKEAVKPWLQEGLTKSQKASIRNRFNAAVESLMASYEMDGIELSKEDAQKICLDYYATSEGYFSMSDEAKQKGRNLSRKQLMAEENSKLEEVENKNGDTVAIENEDTGNIQLSIRTFNEGGRDALVDFLNSRVESKVLTQQEADQIVNQVDELYKICDEYDDGRFAPFSAWSNASVVTVNGRPVFSVVKANGEYKLNLDFSLVCKKRRTLDAVFNEMISRGIMDNFDMVQESIAKINDIIRDNSFETACGLCFVESKRYRQGMIADAFKKMYNTQVLSLVKKNSGQHVDYFNYGGNEAIQNTGAGIDILPDDELDWTKVDKILNTAKKGTVPWKIANHLKNNPSARKLVQRGDFMSTSGFDSQAIKDPELLKLYNSKKGAGGPKATQSDVQYLNEIIQSGMFNEQAAYEVGGVRIQSFSDYVGRLVFDYIQMTADLAAKKLPAHSYTKEYFFAMQFGLTGIKINMSLVPAIVKNGIAPGLDENGNYAWKDGQSFGSTVYDINGKRLTAAEGFELAKKIQNAEGYSKNCGTIAVGVSDQHIWKMLDDPDIRMIIPYHKSALNHIIAAMMDISKYENYTDYQNTRKWNGKKWVKIGAENEFNFNEALQRLGDAKAATNEYLAWCKENGYRAKFDGTKEGSFFSEHENYYKLLEDFSCYDKDGITNAPMGAVQMRFPTETDAFGSMKELIRQGLEEDALLQARQDASVPAIVDQIEAVLPPFEKTVRDRNAQKKNNAGSTVQLMARESREYNPIREQFAKQGLDQLSEKLGDRFPLSANFEKTIRADNTPLTPSDVVVNGERMMPGESKWQAAKRIYRSHYGTGTTNVTLGSLGIKAQMSYELVDESLSKTPRSGVQNVLDLIPQLKHALENGIFLGVERVHIENEHNPLYGYRIYNAYNYNTLDSEGNVTSSEQRIVVATVVQSLDNAHAYVFRDVKSAPIGGGSSTSGSSVYTPGSTVNNISQLYSVVKRISRKDGGLKYETQSERDMLFPYTERNDGTQYSVRDDNRSDRDLLLSATGLSEAEQKAMDAYRAKVKDYQAREQKVTEALREMDKMVKSGASSEQMRKQRSKVSNLEAGMAKSLRELTAAESGENLREILRREREIQRQRTRNQVNETLTRRELRKRIDSLYKNLSKRMTNPTEKQHIPPQLMKQAAEILEAINMDTTVAGSQRGENLRSKLLELRQTYEQIQNDTDFDSRAVYDPVVADLMSKMVEEIGAMPINRMSVAQLSRVYEVLSAMDKTARTAAKIQIRDQEYLAYDISLAMTKETRDTLKEHRGNVQRYLNASMSPERMFNQLGNHHKNSTWNMIYRMLNDGQLKQTQIMMEGSMIFGDLLTGKDYEKFISPKNTVDIGLKDENGKTIKITHGMMVALYMHLMNEQNTKHVARGGLTIPALDDYYGGKVQKSKERSIRVGGILAENADLQEQLRSTDDPSRILELQEKIDASQLRADAFVQTLRQTIDKQLTAYDRQWIAACRELFDAFSKRQLNDTTMEVYGIKRANVENYFPIWVDGDFLNTPFESIVKDVSLENAGFMKERVDSSKPIRLADVSDVANSQIRKVAQYCGMMPAVRNFNKIWGKTQTGYRDSLQKAVREVYGNSGVDYIEHLMADINGGRRTEGGVLGDLFDTLRGHMAKASLTLNVRTALGQAASYPTAASVLGWDALRKGLGRKVDTGLIEKYSPLLWYRMQGYSTSELGDLATSNKTLDRIWKKAKWATGWIQAVDGLTVGKLWAASEVYVEGHNRNLQKGTDAFYEEVAKVFNDVVERTQPDYTTMQRPDILRNPNAIVKQLTMFMTQRLQNFNIVYDAAATYSQMRKDFKAGTYGVTAEDVRQAGIASRRAVMSQVVAAATMVAFKMLADFLLHSVNAYRDEDEELTGESISLEALDMFLDSLTGNMLGGSEMYDLIESKVFNKTYYGIEISGLSTAKDVISSATGVFELAFKKEEDPKKVWQKADKLAKNLSTLVGIPYGNAEKIIKGLINDGKDIVNGEFMEAGVDRTTTQQAHRLYRAYQAMKYGEAQKIRDQVGDDEKLDTALKKYIKEQYDAKELTNSAVIHHLHMWLEMSEADAEKTVMKWQAELDTGVKYDEIKEKYLAGDLSAEEAAKMKVKYGGAREDDVKEEILKWQSEKNTGIAYEEIDEAFLTDQITAQQAIDMRVKYGGVREADAQDTIRKWQCEKDTGVNYDQMREAFLDDEITTQDVIDMRMKYGGLSYDKAEDTVMKWQLEKDTGIKFDKLRGMFLDGEVSESQLKGYLVDYGGMEEKDAQKAIYRYMFAGDEDKYNSISTSTLTAMASRYYNGFAQAGYSRDDFIDMYNAVNSFTADLDSKGNAISNSKKNKIVAYIDSLPISNDLKDVLYLIEYKESTIAKTPWHKK